MTKDDINFERVSYLISLKLSSENLAKRMYRAKKAALQGDDNKTREYFELSLVKAYLIIKDLV